MNFIISDDDGLQYSKISGDNNKIHIDELTGYNSIFGEKICHGSLIILKFFKIINIKKIVKNYDKFSIKILFFKHFKYNTKISIIKKNKTYKLYQKREQLAEINIKSLNFLKNYSLEKSKISLKINKKFINYYNRQKQLETLPLILNNLTKYVGKIFPGENSIINEININFNKSYDFSKTKTIIFSKKISSRIPIINNKLIHNNFIVEFQTSERPVPKKTITKPNKFIIKKIKQIKENILILGASQGVGRDITNILQYNKQILKIATYNKNLINIKDNKIIRKKIEVKKDIKKINKIISIYSPIKIYYFPSPKIYFGNELNKEIIKEYENIFVKIPLNIIKNNRYKKISFFYPSTININYNKSSIYSKIKLEAESKIKKICSKYNVPYKIFRFPAINSRQSISLLNNNLPNLVEHINANKSLISKIFFIKS